MLTDRQFGLGAVLVNDNDRDRTVDFSLTVSYLDLDVPVRRWYGAGGLAQPSQARCDRTRRYPGSAGVTPRTYQTRSRVGALLQPCTGVPHPQHSPKVS